MFQQNFIDLGWIPITEIVDEFLVQKDFAWAVGSSRPLVTKDDKQVLGYAFPHLGHQTVSCILHNEPVKFEVVGTQRNLLISTES